MPVVDLGAGTCEFINAIRCGSKIAVDTNPAVHQYAASVVRTVVGDIPAVLKELDIGPTITAHPTEVQRKSILDAERAIAELVGAVTGIGHQLAVAQELFSVADVFAWTLILVALLFILEAIVVRVERRVLRWRA